MTQNNDLYTNLFTHGKALDHMGSRDGYVIYRPSFVSSDGFIMYGETKLYYIGISPRGERIVGFDRNRNIVDIDLEKLDEYKQFIRMIIHLRNIGNQWSIEQSYAQKPVYAINKDSSGNIIEFSMRFPHCPIFDKVYHFHKDAEGDIKITNGECNTKLDKFFYHIDEICSNDHEIYVELVDNILCKYLYYKK